MRKHFLSLKISTAFHVRATKGNFSFPMRDKAARNIYNFEFRKHSKTSVGGFLSRNSKRP